MLNLLIYLMISIGCSYLWSISDIFMPIRYFIAKYFPSFLRKMLLCMECSSFWIGLFISLFVLPFPSLYLNNYIILNSIFGGISTYLAINILNNLNLTKNKYE